MQATAARHAARGRARDVSEFQPAALMPQWAARLLGFAALALVAALEWRRLLAPLGSRRARAWGWRRRFAPRGAGGAVAWVIAATAAGGAVGAPGRLSGRRRGLALVAV